MSAQENGEGSGKPFVRLCRVHKRYPTAGGGAAALNDVTLDVWRGEFVAVVGRSGAGKSTLLNMVAGVDDLTAGEVWIDGVAVHKLDENARSLWRGRMVGVVYQSFELLPQLSLLDNVLLPMDLCGLYRGRRSVVRAQQLLDRVGLVDHMHKPPTRISGGQKQRVAIARALANDPPILVADEPTGNLDSATAGEILDLFGELVGEGRTILMVTHDRSLAEQAGRVVEIRDGRLVQPPVATTTRSRAIGSPATLRPVFAAGGYDD